MYTFGQEPLRPFLFATKWDIQEVVKMEAPDDWPLTLPGSCSFFLPFCLFSFTLFQPHGLPGCVKPLPVGHSHCIYCRFLPGRREETRWPWAQVDLPWVRCAQRLQLSGTVHSYPLKEPWREGGNLYKLSLQIHGGRKNKRVEKGDNSVWICSSIL